MRCLVMFLVGALFIATGVAAGLHGEPAPDVLVSTPFYEHPVNGISYSTMSPEWTWPALSASQPIAFYEADVQGRPGVERVDGLTFTDPNLADGERCIRVRGVSETGHRGDRSEFVCTHIDRTAPSLALERPAPGLVYFHGDPIVVANRGSQDPPVMIGDGYAFARAPDNSSGTESIKIEIAGVAANSCSVRLSCSSEDIGMAGASGGIAYRELRAEARDRAQLTSSLDLSYYKIDLGVIEAPCADGALAYCNTLYLGDIAQGDGVLVFFKRFAAGNWAPFAALAAEFDQLTDPMPTLQGQTREYRVLHISHGLAARTSNDAWIVSHHDGVRFGEFA